ncbi:hypothetical protein [Pseudooceanicola sp.]|uniref:hypothetical protein n=1 Tax=Pseudooceanicola sp. TaxID=1914328 RepID=UPI0035C6AB54
MNDKSDTSPTPIGVYGRVGGARITSVEVIAGLVSVLWLLGAGVFFLVLGAGEAGTLEWLTAVMLVLAIILPVAMIWVVVAVARSSRAVREDSQRLQAAVEAIRDSYMSGMRPPTDEAGEDSISRKLDEIAAAQRKTETALATFHSTRSSEAPKRETPEPAPVPQEDQAPLPLDVAADAEQVKLPNSTLIRALNFPETAEDEDGFAALRTALRDRVTANLVQAAQDVLTLLSQDGIYMDDLRPDMARPELWRRFAQGERGRVVAGLGGIRDRSSLALTAGRMRQDPIFRDAAHHFLRRFDAMLQDFEPSATDQEISSLAETRTARAFMLLGRVAGVFA